METLYFHGMCFQYSKSSFFERLPVIEISGKNVYRHLDAKAQVWEGIGNLYKFFQYLIQ